MLHPLHSAAQDEAGRTCCTCCLQEFPFVTHGAHSRLRLLPARSAISNMNCAKQSGLPSQTDPAFCSVMRVMLHLELT